MIRVGQSRRTAANRMAGASLTLIDGLAPAAWYRYGIGITVVGQGVDTWADQSGNAQDLRQVTDLNRPTKNADGSISCDGIATYLKKSLFTSISQPFTIATLARVDTYVNGGRLIACANGLITTATQINLSQGLSLALASSPAAGAWAVIIAVANGASSSIQNGLTAASTGDAGTGATGTAIGVGATNAGANFLACTLGEIIIAPGAWDASTRARVARYLAAVKGISI